jgi:uncharacterized Zn finger protein
MTITEAVTDKARRLLADGAVFIRLVQPEIVRASVRGDHGIHTIELERGRWWCTCEARGDCSHLVAVRLVTVPEAAP